MANHDSQGSVECANKDIEKIVEQVMSYAIQ